MNGFGISASPEFAPFQTAGQPWNIQTNPGYPAILTPENWQDAISPAQVPIHQPQNDRQESTYHAKVQGANELRAQESTEHTDLLCCAECNFQANTKAALNSHAWCQGHSAFACTYEDCGSTFTRREDRKRHFLTHQTTAPRFSCDHCKNPRNPRTFKRKDHLQQHLRNYHRIDGGIGLLSGYSCPRVDCKESRSDSAGRVYWPVCFQMQAPFKTLSEYRQHMVKAHNFSPMPCTVAGCAKGAAGKGYWRKRDLFKHHQKAHPEEEFEIIEFDHLGDLIGA